MKKLCNFLCVSKNMFFLSVYIREYLEFHTYRHTHTSSTQKEQNKEYIVFCSELKGYSQAHMR